MQIDISTRQIISTSNVVKLVALDFDGATDEELAAVVGVEVEDITVVKNLPIWGRVEDKLLDKLAQAEADKRLPTESTETKIRRIIAETPVPPNETLDLVTRLVAEIGLDSKTAHDWHVRVQREGRTARTSE